MNVYNIYYRSARCPLFLVNVIKKDQIIVKQCFPIACIDKKIVH